MTALDRTMQFLAMCIKLPQTRLCGDFILKVVVFTYIISTSVCTEELVPVQVNRRYSNDVYYSDFEQMSHSSCSEGDNVTFVVSERRCVSNEELHNGCKFPTAPNDSDSRMTLTIVADIRNLNMSAFLMTALTVRSAHKLAMYPTTIIYREQQHSAGHSFSDCHIDSLEVYRGRQHTSMISHVGFLITNEGTIEIEPKNLTYKIEEYKGELYRMNLSCGAQERGCLFFKVIGWSNVTDAKFHGAVLSTVQTLTSEEVKQSTLKSATTTVPMNSSLAVLDIATYAILAIAGFLVLLFVIVLFGTILFYCGTKDRRRKY